MIDAETEQKIFEEARRKSETGKTSQQIADEFGVTINVVSRIISKYMPNKGAFKTNYLKNKDEAWIAWFSAEWNAAVARLREGAGNGKSR